MRCAVDSALTHGDTVAGWLPCFRWRRSESRRGFRAWGAGASFDAACGACLPLWREHLLSRRNLECARGGDSQGSTTQSILPPSCSRSGPSPRPRRPIPRPALQLCPGRSGPHCSAAESERVALLKNLHRHPCDLNTAELQASLE